jgi:hypothetical protein
MIWNRLLLYTEITNRSMSNRVQTFSEFEKGINEAASFVVNDLLAKQKGGGLVTPDGKQNSAADDFVAGGEKAEIKGVLVIWSPDGFMSKMMKNVKPEQIKFWNADPKESFMVLTAFEKNAIIKSEKGTVIYKTDNDDRWGDESTRSIMLEYLDEEVDKEFRDKLKLEKNQKIKIVWEGDPKHGYEELLKRRGADEFKPDTEE